MHCDVRTRKMCVCARTGWCGVYTLPSHARLLLLAECETARSSNVCRKMEQDCSQTHQLMVTMLNLSSTHAVSSCYLNVSSMSLYFTIVLTICRLATCAGAISANFESMKTNSTMFGLVTSFKMMMVVDVLNFAVQQIVPTNAYSTIPGTLVVRGQFCSVDASCH